jgi:uncharacterized protein
MPDGKRYRILSLDGGGIRGLISALWLQRLEAELGSPLRDHFDLIAGTSTGAILACGVATGMPAEEMVQLYRRNGREIFPALPSRLWSRVGRVFSEGVSAPKYSDQGIKAVLQRVFGDTTLADVPAAKVLLITAYNTLARDAVVIKNRNPAYAQLKLWEVAKASAAAPTYFPAHVLDFGTHSAPLIDGGVVANNPTACAIAEGVRVNGERPEGCKLDDFIVASFGTGESTRPIGAAEAREWGALEWAIPIIDVLMDGAGDATDYVASYLVPKDRYFRLQTRLDTAYDDLDRADATNLNALANEAHAYLEREGKHKLKRLAALLKQS